jgi:tetratricopeptide (TPR) repeat protein
MDESLRSNVASSHREIARLDARRGEFDAALQEYQIAIGICEELLTKDPANANWLSDVATLYAGAGDVLMQKSDWAAALERYRKAYAARRTLTLKDKSDPPREYALAIAGIAIADALVRLQQGLDEAVSLCRAAITSLDDPNLRYDLDVFNCYIKIGGVAESRKDPQNALTEYETALGIARRAATKDPASETWQRSLADAYVEIGELLIAQGRTNEALAHYKKALKFVEELAANNPQNAGWAALVQELKSIIEKLA